MTDVVENLTAAIDVVAERLTTEIVGHTDDYNGGRLSGDQAKGLAQLAVSALLTQGWAVVRLPVGEDLRHGYCLEVRDEHRIRDHGPVDSYTPQDARDFAAALLAAADDALGLSFT